jgi:hypothetical protein
MLKGPQGSPYGTLRSWHPRRKFRACSVRPCGFPGLCAAAYGCAPAGYYGPEWFSGGVFIGAGPWFHGPGNFHGSVNNGFHPEHGYKGPMPNRGERADPSRRVDRAHFNGNERRDGRGHTVEGKR